MLAGKSSFLVGRESELDIITRRLSLARSGAGGALLVVGEPGIGKTALLEQAVSVASREGFRVIRSACQKGSAQPFQLFSPAIAAFLGESALGEAHAVAFSSVLALSPDMTVSAKAQSGGDAVNLSEMLIAVQSFIRDSFDAGGAAADTIGRLEMGRTKVLIERGDAVTLVGVVLGDDTPEMRSALSSAAASLRPSHASSGGASPVPDTERAVSELLARRFRASPGESPDGRGDERLRLAERLLRAMESRMPSGPLLLAFEDLHWADSGDLFLFSYLARNVRSDSVLVLAAARGQEEGAYRDALARMRDEGTLEEARLAGLGPAAVREMIDAMYHPNMFYDAFYSEVAARTEGNPLFVRELMRHLLSAGAVRIEAGSYVPVQGEMPMPGRISEIIQRRLEALPPESLSMAEYLACSGRGFDRDLALSNPFVAEPSAALDGLASAGLVAGGGDDFEFVHALYPEAVVEGVSQRWLAKYHLALGAYLEGTLDRDPDAVYEVARHFTLSGNRSKALDYSVAAGRRAEAAHSPELARELLASAERLLGSAEGGQRTGALVELDDRLAGLDSMLGDFKSAESRYLRLMASFRGDAARSAVTAVRLAKVHRNLNKLRETVELLEPICAEGGALGPAHLAECLSSLAYAKGGTGEPDAARALISRAVAAAKRSEDPAVSAKVHQLCGSTLVGMSDYPAAEVLFETAITSAKESGSDALLATALDAMAELHHYRGAHEKSARALERALAVHERTGDVSSQIRVLGLMGMALSDTGDLEGSVACLRRALAWARKTGKASAIASLTGNLGYTLAVMGRFDEGIALQREAMGVRERAGLGESGWPLSDLGMALEMAGRPGEARPFFESAHALFEKRGDVFGRVVGSLMLGGNLVDRGEREEGVRILSLATSLARDQGMARMETEGMILLREAGAGDADDFAARARELGSGEADPSLRLELPRLVALLHVQGGRIQEAMEVLERGIAEGMRSKNPSIGVMTADLLLMKAECLARQSRRAEALAILAEARKRYDALNRVVQLRKCAELEAKVMNG